MSTSSEATPYNQLEGAAARILAFFRENPVAQLAPSYITGCIVGSFPDRYQALADLVNNGALQLTATGLIRLASPNDTDLRFRFARAMVFIDALGGWERPDGVFEMKPANNPEPK